MEVSETSDVDSGVRVSGTGLTLRPWRPGDEGALVRALNDPDVERFMNAIPVPYSTADAMAWVCELAPAAWAAGGAEFALDLGDGLAIGSLGVRREDRGDGVVGVVGYWVTPPCTRTRTRKPGAMPCRSVGGSTPRIGPSRVSARPSERRLVPYCYRGRFPS